MNYPEDLNTIDTDIHESLAMQVEKISVEIAEKWKEFDEIGLLEGKSGMVILFAYLSKLFPGKSYEATTLYYLNDLRESLTRDVLGYNLSGGLAGIGFVFQHLKNLDVLDTWVDFDLSGLDELIGLGADRDYKTGNWDPLLGLTGLGIYFLERNKETGEKKHLEKIVDYLAGMTVTAAGQQVWITPGYNQYSNDNYNFGMAHGMPGVLSFLAQVHTRGIKQHKTEEMIASCLSFLQDHQYPSDSPHHFPMAIDVAQAGRENKPFSRLAWCYGDLCMANTLIHCGGAMHRSDWYDQGIDVALKTTQQSFEESGCIDAPFCHGTVGLVHQYHRLYHLTQNKVFKDARNNWLDLTQQHFYKPGEGAGGYSFGSFNEETGEFDLTPQWGLLEGSAGIALVYLSILYSIKPDWDIIFLTNV